MVCSKKLFIVVGLLGLFSVCKGQENVEQPATMPQGKLLRVMYDFYGMRMDEFNDFDLKRSAETGRSEFRFKHSSSEVSIDGVDDSLFTAACRIIEEERMYEYSSYYGLSPELQKSMLDGFRWSFDAYFENGGRISSSGCHVMPDGEGLRRIEKLLYDIAEAAINMTLDKHKD
jgi:hypothetical protein